MGTKRSIADLILQRVDPDYDIRKAAAKALCRIDRRWRRRPAARRSVPKLIAKLADPDWRVCDAAVEVLASLGDRRAVAAIERVLASDESAGVKMSAIAALRRFRRIPPLVRSLNDESWWVQRQAEQALDKISPYWMRSRGVVECVPELSATLKSQEPEFRRLAAKVLGESRDGRAVDALLGAFEDEDRSVRAIAADALRKIGDRRAVEPLERLAASDPSDYVRVLARGALRRLK